MNDLYAALSDAQKAQRAMLTPGISPTELYRQTTDRKSALSALDTAWKAYESLPHPEQEQATWKKFVEAWNAWAQDDTTIVDLANQNTEESIRAANTHATKAVNSGRRAESLLRPLATLNQVEAQKTGKSTQDRLSFNTTVLLGTMSFGVLLALFFGIFLSRSITHGIGRVMLVAQEISEGDLTRRIEISSHDEIGRLAAAFNSLADSLHNIIEQIASSSDRVASASEELSATAEQFSSGVDTQLQQSQQIASAIQEMSGSVLEVAKNAQEAASAAKQAADTANNGSRIVGQTIGGIKRIAETVDQAAEKVSALGTSSSQIGEIIEVMDDIADLTNLLALNAAVEAARAGEQGRGFAVVADEVRKLAERTTKATKEIAAMITTIRRILSRLSKPWKAGAPSQPRAWIWPTRPSLPCRRSSRSPIASVAW